MISNKGKPNQLQIYFRGHRRAFSEGLIMPWKKNPIKTLMAILTLSICFYVPLFLWTLWLNYDELKHSWQNQGSIALFVDSNLDSNETNTLLQQIKENEMVESVVLYTEDQVTNQLQADEQLSQFMAMLSSHELPQQISVKISQNKSVDEIEAFVSEYGLNPQIEYVSYDSQWINQLNALTNTLLQMARLSAFLFMLIIMVILGNIIANEVTDHKKELRLLELMGATSAQVRRSFLYMGIFLGIYAGLLAVVFLTVGFWWLEDTFIELLNNFGVDITLRGLDFGQVSAVIFVSILVTWLAARLTLSNQILTQEQD
jgi:cell division transport system permease protein